MTSAENQEYTTKSAFK